MTIQTLPFECTETEEEIGCKRPQSTRSNTFYFPGSQCFDAAAASCRSISAPSWGGSGPWCWAGAGAGAEQACDRGGSPWCSCRDVVGIAAWCIKGRARSNQDPDRLQGIPGNLTSALELAISRHLECFESSLWQLKYLNGWFYSNYVMKFMKIKD